MNDISENMRKFSFLMLSFIDFFFFTETSNRNKNVHDHFMVSDFAAPKRYKNSTYQFESFPLIFCEKYLYLGCKDTL